MNHKTDAVLLQPRKMKENIPGPAGERFHIGLLHGELHIELYVPEYEDLQQPHSRASVISSYVVLVNFKWIKKLCRLKLVTFCLFPLGWSIVFFDFGHSLETWVIFYGPEGGANVE